MTWVTFLISGHKESEQAIDKLGLFIKIPFIVSSN
jgi:hypothetical protein